MTLNDYCSRRKGIKEPEKRMMSGLGGVVWKSGRSRLSVGVASQQKSARAAHLAPRWNLELDEEEVHTGGKDRLRMGGLG